MKDRELAKFRRDRKEYVKVMHQHSRNGTDCTQTMRDFANKYGYYYLPEATESQNKPLNKLNEG